MAQKAGIEISESKLFFDKQGNAHFGTNRFDRGDQNERFHVNTLSNLIHADLVHPLLDYETLIKVSSALTKNQADVTHCYRQMLFNIISHNRDDHGKSFSFKMLQTGEWTLSPSYDLTFSDGPGGQQSTTLAGEGKQPSSVDIEKIAKVAGISASEQKGILNQVKDAVSSWSNLAQDIDIKKSEIDFIEKRLTYKSTQ